MATYLEQVRAAFPDLDTKGYSDEEVVIWLAEKNGRDPQEIGEMLGVYDPNQGDFSRGVSAAIDSTQGMAYGAGALVADTFGADSARNSMLRGYQKNMAQVQLRSKPTDSYEGLNSFGDAVDFAQYYSGYGLAQGAQAIATGGLGSLIGKQVVKQGIKRAGKDLLSDSSQAAVARGGKVGGYGGFGAQAVGTELGATYGGAVDRALETGQSIDDINLGKVYGYGTAAGLMEGVADVATAGLARMGPAKNLMEAVSKTRKRGVVTGAGKGAAVEGFTEGVQTGLEDLGAGYSLEESRFFDPTSVLAGAIGGGQLGAAGGLLRSPQQSGTNPNEIAEAAKANVGEQLQMDLDDPSTPEQLQAQYEEEQRKADAINKLSKERQDAENDAFRVEAQAFTKKDFKKQLATGLEATVDDRTSDLGREFLAELNTPTDENPTGLIDPDDIKAARAKFVKRKTDEQAGTLSEAYVSEIQRRVSEKANSQNQIELDFNQATAQEKQQTELDKPALSATKAIEQTERMFGKDWIASGKYDDLETAVNAPKFNRKKYAEALDKAVNPPAPTPVNTSADDGTSPSTQAAAEVADAAATLTAPEGLSEDQAKIFKVIADRFTGDKQYDIDTVYAGGKFLSTKIAELAGVGQNAADKGKSNVSQTIERLMTKVVENQGKVKRNSPKAEKDAAVKALAKSLSTRAKEQRQEQIKGSQNQADTSGVFDASVEEDTSNQTGVSIDRISGTGKKADAAIQSALKSMPEVGAPIQGTENKADADEALDNVEAMDRAELGVGGSFSTKASVGQGNYGGVYKEDKKFSQSRTTTDEEVAAVAAKENQKIDDAVESQSAILKGVWDSGKSPDTMSFVDLSAPQKREVWFIVRQYLEDSRKKGNDPKASLELARAELAQIETTLAPVEESDTNETTISDAEQRRSTEAEESVRRERDASPTGTGSSGSGNVSEGQEAATDAQENKTVVERKSKKKLVNAPEKNKNVRNVESFKESYKNDIEDFRANPALAEPAAFADYLNSLTDAQWKKLTPVFGRDFNPFKSPSMDVAQIRGFVDNALGKGKAKFSKKSAINESTTVSKLQVLADGLFEDFTTDPSGLTVEVGGIYSPIQIHATAKDAVRALKGSIKLSELTSAQGVIDPRDNKRVHLIAENISVGNEAAVIAHEVGVHLGLENKLLSDKEMITLSQEVNKWSSLDETSVERQIHDAVVGRIAFARMHGMVEEQIPVETVAYAVEEAVARGVTPRADEVNKAAWWLSKVQNFFAELTNRWFNVKNPDPFFGLSQGSDQAIFRASELVALAQGAAQQAMAGIAVEKGAVSNKERDIAGYYMNVAEDKVPADASVEEFVADFEDGSPIVQKGGEIFGWGEDSKFGAQTGIGTVAYFDGGEMEMQLFSSEVARPILTVALARAEYNNAPGEFVPNVYLLSIFGPDGNITEDIGIPEDFDTTKTKDINGSDWVRLEGVRHRDVVRVLTEARRRMTRYRGGRIPNIAYNRVTGAAATTTDTGRVGSKTDKELFKRFSFKDQTPISAAKREARREFVRDQLGGDTAVNIFDTAVEIATKAAGSVKFVHNIVRDNRESMPALGRWYDAMLKVETTRTEIKKSFQDIVKQARTLQSDRLTVVNNFLGDSTFDQQWGYDPKEYHPDLFADRKVEINSGKKTRFDRLSDSEKKIVTDIFAHGERMRQRKIALAKKLGVTGKFFTDASLEGPYAPLKRFGSYVGELKSGRLIEAERAATAEGATKKQKEFYEKLKSDRDHYVVSFFDTMGSAKQFVDQNKKNYAFSQASELSPNIESDRVSNSEVYEKVMGALAASEDASMDSGAKTAFRKMVRDMYFQSMDERSARTSGAKRLNRAGYEQNMMRSFLSHANSEASLIAQMENGTEVNTAFAEAGNQTLVETGEGRDPAKQRAFNSIAKHYQNTLSRNETPIQDRISTMNSVYMLLTSVGYHLTNATQPMMVSVPRIAGDFGNYNNAWSAMFRGYKYSRAAAKIGLNMETEIDLQKVPQEYRALLQSLQDRNLIDQGMEEDGSFNRFNTGFEVLNRTSDVLGTITSKLYNVAKFVEAQNRISTAVAAYDAARANPTKLAAMKMTPEQYATAVVEDTQGNFSQLDAPLLIKSLPKVVTQYRKYQLLMAWHYSSAFKQGFFGESPEVKAAGRRVLAYSVGHAAMGAGATGIPLVSFAFWISTFLGVGDDEPMDMERYIKENIDDGVLGQALSRGVFSTFGLDLSTKLNQGKIFHPLPYVDFEAGEEGARNIIMGAVGPAGTTGVNFFRAAEYYKQGDLLKGIEYSMPKGIRSVAESYRLATEGMTTKSGTVVVDPREIDVVSLLINAMGLPASEINSLKWTKGQQYELEQYFNKEGGKIRKQYIEATRNRDRAAQAEMRQEFRDLQKAKDRVRPFFNNAPGVLKRQSLSTLLRAPRAKDKLEKREQEKLR